MRNIIVVGAGVAGLSAALSAAAQGAHVALVYPGRSIAESAGSTQLAQGGIAAALAPGDDADKHWADTLSAGAGLVDAHSAHILTREGAREVARLVRAGFPVDRTTEGEIDFGLEAAHGLARIVHAGGDRTGAALHRFLIEMALQQPLISHFPGHELRSIITSDGQARGITVRNESLHPMLGDAVVIATGGYCGVYSRSTGSPQATGRGIAAAARAGALVADMEFVQFHPTVLAGTGNLISEAVRGAGAVLIDATGNRFMFDHDPRGELAPRDVVSNGVFHALQRGGVWLDATGIAEKLPQEFPGISAMLAREGYDWAAEPIPVAPASHYCMGGIATDSQARSSLPGLYAAGEVANTGVHGANRLASNSLLEGLVFGARAGADAATWSGTSWEADLDRLLPAIEVPAPTHAGTLGHGSPRELIDAHLSIERNAEGLQRCVDGLLAASGTERAGARGTGGTGAGDIVEIGLMIATGALAREESRGAHRRSDFPHTDPAQARSQALTLRSLVATQNAHPEELITQESVAQS